jgi:hypothetical protein
MSLFERLRYSLYLAVVVGAALGLLVVLASSDVLRLLPSSAFELVFSPLYMLVLFAVAFLVAAQIAPRLPISRRRS